MYSPRLQAFRACQKELLLLCHPRKQNLLYWSQFVHAAITIFQSKMGKAANVVGNWNMHHMISIFHGNYLAIAHQLGQAPMFIFL